MTDPDWQGRRTARPGLRVWAYVVLLILSALLAALAAACLPVERHEVVVPSSSAISAAAHRIDLDRDRAEARRASRARPSPAGEVPARRVPHEHHRRPALGLPAVAEGPIGFEVWRHSQAALAIVQCESGRDGSWAWHYGTYRGYWQIGPSEWRDWGGLRFAAHPEDASRVQQDLVAYTGYRARGWEPWTCARQLGYWP